MFAQKDSGLDVSAGQMIMNCEPMFFSLETTQSGGSMLTITLENTREAKLLLRSGPEGGSI